MTPEAQDAAFHSLALASVPGVGPVLARRLIRRFGTAAAVFRASEEEFLEIEGVGPAGARALAAFDAFGGAEAEVAQVLAAGYGLLALEDPRYPEALRAVEDAPTVLYLAGEIAPADAAAVAVVGTRNASDYGREMTARFAAGLAEAGVTVVSGLARGIDTVAHEAALAAGGRTVAVLGAGLDRPYPPENKGLLRRIAEEGRGAAVTEFPLGTPPEARNFPRRNRVISGFALGVLVVEAAERSGSLITARTALEQGREVFAVPGPLTWEHSRGANRLIRAGAKLVERAEDVLEEIPALRALAPAAGAPKGRVIALKPRRGSDEPSTRAPEVEAPGLSPEERKVFEALGLEARHVDEVVAATGLGVSTVSGALLGLELSGLAKQIGGARYVRTR